MRASLERLLGKGRLFPVEITLSSGDRHEIPNPDHAAVHPNTGDLIIFPDEGEYLIAVNPAQIVSIKTVNKSFWRFIFG